MDAAGEGKLSRPFRTAHDLLILRARQKEETPKAASIAINAIDRTISGNSISSLRRHVAKAKITAMERNMNPITSFHRTRRGLRTPGKTVPRSLRTVPAILLLFLYAIN